MWRRLSNTSPPRWLMLGILVALPALVAGVQIGRKIRWQEGIYLSVLFEIAVQGLVVVAVLVVGVVLIALHKRTVGRILIMPALCYVLAIPAGFAIGPTNPHVDQYSGEIELVLSEPAAQTLTAPAVCRMYGREAVRQVEAVSIGYVLGERISVSMAVVDWDQPRLLVRRGQELAEGGRQLPTYAVTDESELKFSASDRNVSGTLGFVRLRPEWDGLPLGMGASDVILTGELRWSCSERRFAGPLEAGLIGRIAFTGAVSGTLQLEGFCHSSGLWGPFEGEVKIEGEPTRVGVDGTLEASGQGWTLALLGLSGRETQSFVAASAAATQTADAAGVVVGSLDAEFMLPPGMTLVQATWRCLRS